MILQIDANKIDFQQLVENSLNSILIIGQECNILYCNHAFLNLFNLSSVQEIINKDIYSLIHPEYHLKSKERLKRLFMHKEILERTEIKLLRSDGKIIEVEVSTVPFYHENQVFAQVTMQNITDRIAAEKLLKDREKLISIGQIAAGIAHEVKNPLTAVKGFLQLIKETSTHPYLDIMDDELEKALTTLENLLQVSKPDLQSEPLIPIELSKELASIISLFKERLYTVKVEMDLRDSEKTIIGKRNLFQKAFFNLIKNAIEAIEGHGTIKIEHFYKDEWIHIKISDSGAGIPKEKIKLLGTPFFTSKHEGTGLGLTQVFTTIHEHQGTISIQSEVGKGTTIQLKLPYNP